MMILLVVWVMLKSPSKDESIFIPNECESDFLFSHFICKFKFTSAWSEGLLTIYVYHIGGHNVNPAQKPKPYTIQIVECLGNIKVEIKNRMSLPYLFS